MVLRLPVNMLDSPTSQGLLQQLQISLSLLMEDAASLPRALANRLSFYGTALHTLYKILESGHCSSCPEGSKPCSFCRAVMFRDFVHVTIQGELHKACAKTQKRRQLIGIQKSINKRIASCEICCYSVL